MARSALAIAAALICAPLAWPVVSTPVLAADMSPVGQWEVTTGESRYRISYCGEGKQVCAKLTWLRADARTKENLALLNKTVVRGAPADANSWRGKIIYGGQSYDSTVTLVSNNSMRFNSCSGIFCQSFELKRR